MFLLFNAINITTGFRQAVQTLIRLHLLSYIYLSTTLDTHTGLYLRVRNRKKKFSYFTTKPYVVGTQKNRFN